MKPAIDLSTPHKELERALQDALAVEFRRLGAERFGPSVAFPVAMVSVGINDDVIYFRGTAHGLLRAALEARDLDHLSRLGDFSQFGPLHGSTALKRNLRAAASSLEMSIFVAQVRESRGNHSNPHVLAALAAARATLAHQAQQHWDRKMPGGPLEQSVRPLRAALAAAVDTYRFTARYTQFPKTSRLCERQIETLAPVLEKCDDALKAAKRARRLANKAQSELRKSAELGRSIFAP